MISKINANNYKPAFGVVSERAKKYVLKNAVEISGPFHDKQELIELINDSEKMVPDYVIDLVDKSSDNNYSYTYKITNKYSGKVIFVHGDFIEACVVAKNLQKPKNAENDGNDAIALYKNTINGVISNAIIDATDGDKPSGNTFVSTINNDPAYDGNENVNMLPPINTTVIAQNNPNADSSVSDSAIAQESNLPAEKVLLESIKRGQKFDISAENDKGDTLFQVLVDNNYTKVMAYLATQKIDLSKVLKRRNHAGKLPSESASSVEMELLLKVIENRNTNVNPNNVPSQEPAIQEPQSNQCISAVTTSDNSTGENVDYFGGVFENVEEENNQISQQKEKKVIDHSGLDDFKLLEIRPDDVKSMGEFIGYDDIKDELKQNVIGPITNDNVMQGIKDNNINLPNGILITGKTGAISLVKALSQDALLPVIIMDSPAELSVIMPAIEKRYQDSGLRTAILAQGFDKYFTGSFPPALLNTFKNNLKNIKDKGGLFIATAPDRKNIDCEFLESGIIDKHIELEKPNDKDRDTFVRRYFQNREIFKDLMNDEDIKKIALLTDNLTYSDIIRILDSTAMKALNANTNADMSIFNERLKKFSKETGIEPITPENKTASYDTPEFKRIPISKGEMMSLSELGGMPEIKQKLRDLYVTPMKDIEDATKDMGNDAMPDGAIFHGLPGNGKSLTARVLARELGLPYYELNMTDFGTALVHESGKTFKKYIDQLVNKFKQTGEYSVLFIDEFDTVGASRNGQGYHDNELTNTLLRLFNNPQENGIIIITATNNLDDVDSALKRRGRLGNWIEFKNPNQEEREDTIRKILSKREITKEYANDNNLVTETAKELDGFPMACIAYTLKDATRYFRNKELNLDFEASVKRALKENIERQLAEYLHKAHLTEHKYDEYSYKSLDELGGMEEVKKQLEYNVINAWNPEIRKALIANKQTPPSGFILEGPPGSGKTTIIETLARQMGVPLFKMDYNQEGNEYIHQVAKHVREIFSCLEVISKFLKKPVMLLFDEAERFFPNVTKLGHLQAHSIEEVNTYKELMNTAASKGIILAGATNHIDLVNQEIIGNPRRMGTVIHCPNPDFESRKDIAKKLLKGLPVIKGDISKQNLEAIANVTEGFSIGEMSDSINKIVTQAIMSGKDLSPEVVVKNFKNIISQKQE